MGIQINSMSMNKIIWMYWDRGLEQAPDLVKLCVSSWRCRNPGWEVRVLDEQTLADWVDMTNVRERNPKLTIQAFCDILRWRLLARYGGVWGDATLYCSRPLDEWLPENAGPRGFFAFRTPENHLYHSWFLAGEPDNPVVQAMNTELDRFFVTYGGYRHYWDIRGLWRIFRFVENRAGRFNQEIWRSAFFRRFLKAAPYFFQNYLTGAALRRNADARAEFDAVAIRFGEGPHALQNLTVAGGMPSLDQVRGLISGPSPVQKLTIKRFAADWAEAGILDLLEDACDV